MRRKTDMLRAAEVWLVDLAIPGQQEATRQVRVGLALGIGLPGMQIFEPTTQFVPPARRVFGGIGVDLEGEPPTLGHPDVPLDQATQPLAREIGAEPRGQAGRIEEEDELVATQLDAHHAPLQ